jgi:hypothetical protein
VEIPFTVTKYGQQSDENLTMKLGNATSAIYNLNVESPGFLNSV